MRYSLWNLCAQADAPTLLDALDRSGFALRSVETAGVSTAQEFIDRCAETFGFPSGGWDSFGDDMWNVLFPDDDEGDKVAFVWNHADALLDEGLDAMLHAVDVLAHTGRAAYADGVEIITFLLGDGPNFARVDVADLFPTLG
ncbi:MAG: barstar family protein [Ilumatobacter sp.]|uniref:barstar family protein n=1 Tax=Ilumatobacter sp. TaxID=1967498 RepID=UPI00391ACCBC